MTWIKIGTQERAGASWKPTDPKKPIEKYKRMYDAGEGAISQRRSRDGLGFDLLYEQNPPPHTPRQYHMRWFQSRKSPAQNYTHYASRKWSPGKGKYDG